MWKVRITGTPAPKGSLKCVGRNGHHQLIEELGKTVKPWRALIKLAGERIRQDAGDQLSQGPVSIDVTFTLPRPASVKPAQRMWPWKRQADLDKLLRCAFDGITDSRLWGDDSQVVEIVARKAYPDTLDCVDRLPQPGAVIKIWRTDL